jgi:uncharacterized membrane protein SpoIIM required for sporulation
MKIFLVWFLVIVIGVVLSVSTYMASFPYKQNVESHLGMADDASTAALKLEHLLEYKKSVLKMVKGDDARFIFKTPQTKKAAQMAILDSLIDRVSTTAKMKTDSFEYQTAMNQITGQEFEGTIASTNQMFFSMYLRQNGWNAYMWMMGIWLMILLIALFITAIVICCNI